MLLREAARAIEGLAAAARAGQSRARALAALALVGAAMAQLTGQHREARASRRRRCHGA